MQRVVLARREQWIMDGDLGPYDAVELRLRRSGAPATADLVILRDPQAVEEWIRVYARM